MSGELKHATVGTTMTQAEFEAVGLHVVDSQATGDLIYASSNSQLSRLGIGSTGALLTVSSGIPAWTSYTITNDGTKTTIAGISGDYWRVGDAAATSRSLASEDDLMVTGKLEVDGLAFFDSTVTTSGNVGIGTTALNNISVYATRTLALTDNTDQQGISAYTRIYKTSAVSTTTITSGRCAPEIHASNTQNWTNALAIQGLNTQLVIAGTNTFTVTGAVGLYVQSASFQSNATVTTLYGILLASESGVNVGTKYGIYINAYTGGTVANYGIYNVSSPIYTGGYIEFLEMSAPGVGAANTARIYAQDNGAGKTQIMAQFATGAAQQIAIEP